MHRITQIQIQNFRACQSVLLPLDDFTPLVGQNNVGKSTLLESIRWLLKPDARSSSDFTDTSQPIVVTARIEGIRVVGGYGSCSSFSACWSHSNVKRRLI